MANDRTERLPKPPGTPSDFGELLAAYAAQDRKLADFETQFEAKLAERQKQGRARLAVLLTLVSLLSPLCIEAIRAYRAGPEPAPEVRQADVERIDRDVDRLADDLRNARASCDARVGPLESDARQAARWIDARTNKDAAAIPWRVSP